MTNTAGLSYASPGQGERSTARAIRLAFLLCGVVSTVALLAAVVGYVREPAASRGFANGINALRWFFSPPSDSLDDGPTLREAWGDILSLPVPPLLLIAGLQSKHRRIDVAIRIARLLAAVFLIGIAVDEWLGMAESYLVPLGFCRRSAQAVTLLAFDRPLVPLLIATGIWPNSRRGPIAAAFCVVLTSYSSAMCLNFVDAEYAVFTPVGFVEWDEPSMFTGAAKICDSFSSWLTYPMSYETPPPLHTVGLLWASAIGALVAGICLWTRRPWLGRIGAAALLPAVIVCAADRLIPWFYVRAAWLDHGDAKLIDRLLLMGERCELASPTLPLVAFVVALIITLLARAKPKEDRAAS